MADLQTGSPFPLSLIYKTPGHMSAERRLHRQFQSCRIFGEWFEFTSGQIQGSLEAKYTAP